VGTDLGVCRPKKASDFVDKIFLSSRLQNEHAHARVFGSYVPYGYVFIFP
jgi:hypothetical protein